MPSYYRPKQKFKMVSLEEITRYVEKAPTAEMETLIALAWLTGSRIKELISFQKDDFTINQIDRTIRLSYKALKHGKQANKVIGFDDPFAQNIINYLSLLSMENQKLFTLSKRRYQQLLLKINKTLYGISDDGKYNWITFHYLRHSRITYISQILKATRGEIQSFTGHKTRVYEDYISPQEVDRFAGQMGMI